MSFLTRNELLRVGFKKVGSDVLISDKCSIYGAKNITIGSNVRIDDFCILSGNIVLENNIHIGCYSSLIGKGLITLKDYSGVSQRCTILSSNADYSGEWLTNPNNWDCHLNTFSAPVTLEKHSLIGAGSLVMPNVTIGEGAVLGAMSMTKKDIPPFEIWAGVPAKFIKQRLKTLLQWER